MKGLQVLGLGNLNLNISEIHEENSLEREHPSLLVHI